MILLDLERVVPLRGRENGVSAESVVWMAVGYGMACTVSRVQALICVAVMGEHSKVSKCNTVLPGIYRNLCLGASGSKRLNRSALPFCAPSLYSLV